MYWVKLTRIQIKSFVSSRAIEKRFPSIWYYEKGQFVKLWFAVKTTLGYWCYGWKDWYAAWIDEKGRRDWTCLEKCTGIYWRFQKSI